MSIDSKIKSKIKCPHCGEKVKYDGKSMVSSMCGSFSKGGFDHIHFINKQIAIGNGSVPFDWQVLDLLGIKFVFGVANDFPGDEWLEHTIHLPNLNIPLHDSKDNTIRNYNEAIYEMGMLVPRYSRFLVHCMGGGRRSVSVVAYYLSGGQEKKYWSIIRKFKKVRGVVRLEEGIHDFVIEQGLLK